MKSLKASQTALKVALNVAALKHIDNPVPDNIIDGTIELLKQNGEIDRVLRKHLDPKIVKTYYMFDKILPGQFEAIGERKKYFYDKTIDALEKGCRQILSLGAGYDVACLQLAERYPGVNFFEIDAPSTMMHKIKAVEKLGKPSNLTLIPVDLGEHNLKQIINGKYGWNKNVKSAFLGEGLLMYLTEETIVDLLRQLKSICARDSLFVFSYVKKDAEGNCNVSRYPGLFRFILKLSKEPWLWFADHECPHELFRKNGWNIGHEPNVHYGVEYMTVAESY